jgi:hypothetical protein
MTQIFYRVENDLTVEMPRSLFFVPPWDKTAVRLDKAEASLPPSDYSFSWEIHLIGVF